MQHRVRSVAQLTRGIDPWLMLSVLALVGFGVLMVYSASIADAIHTYGSPTFVAQREAVWAVLGFTALAVGVNVPYQRWRPVALMLAGITVVMLMAVLVPHFGHEANGARRWFLLSSGVDLQPSELAKLSLILYVSAWLSNKGDSVRDFKHTVFPFALILGLVAMLILKEPDLGTTVVVVATMICILFIAGADVVQLLGLGAFSSLLAWTWLQRSSYTMSRLLAFQNPWQDARGAGYHTIQALLALGSGGIIGQGLGNSIQKDVLPAPHTDSILAVIGEEWGLVGTVGVLLLFLVIAYRGLRIAITAPDPFGRLVATGITSWITIQALMNFGVITSSVPFTGVPLPFISYGGTSLVITMAAMGILLNISRHASGPARAQDNIGDRGRHGRTRVPRVIDNPAPSAPPRRAAAPASNIAVVRPGRAKRPTRAGTPSVRRSPG
jgi:cell division protein FtsW